jgi:hypothetical protein
MSQPSNPLRPSERHTALQHLILVEQEIAGLKAAISHLPELDGRIDALVTQLLEKVRQRNHLIEQITGLNIPVRIELFFA